MTRSIAFALLSLLIGSSAHAIYVAPAFPNLPAFNEAVEIQDPRDGTDRLFVVERGGFIYVFQNDVSAVTRAQFLDISNQVTTQTEAGLLGLTFHPNYENNRFFYVLYVSEGPRRTIVSRFTTNAVNPSVADIGSEVQLLVMPMNNLYHKGGHIDFGPDGYLYIGLGDDGDSAGSQDRTDLVGKLLRIDVDNPSGGKQYGIPPSNPFAGNLNGYREEIYAYGFRNPWRYSFDPPTGRIWLGDVGQDTWEEVDIVRKGRNYGWPKMEGLECYSPAVCDTNGLHIDLPKWVYEHGGGGASITGGYVYRGPGMPSLTGKYIYADFISGDMWALTYNGVTSINVQLPIDPEISAVSTFGVDKDGELYFASFDGEIYRFFESTTSVRAPAPAAGSLGSAYPNPFAANVSVEYTLAADARATLEIFDVRGARVAMLVDGSVTAGTHTATWNGRGPEGARRSSGIYFCRLSVGGMSVGVQRIILLK